MQYNAMQYNAMQYNAMQYNAIPRKHSIHSLHTIHTIRTINTIHTAGGYMVRTHLTHPHVKHSKVSANERSNRYSPTYPVWLKTLL